MKLSAYNLSFISNDLELLFNTATGFLLAFPITLRSEVDPIARGEHSCREDIRDALLKGGMLIPDDVDELRVLKTSYMGSTVVDPVMRMMLCTTTQCNFRCDYCFEGLFGPASPVKEMTELVQDGVFELVSGRVNELERLQIHWFGGEPLLNPEPIERLGARLRTLALEHDVIWDAEIISNGYLLDSNRADWLYRLGVKKAQITLDGCEASHDHRRSLGGKAPTFRTIVSNIVSWQDTIEPKIRINVDRRNIDGMYRMVDELIAAGVSSHARLHFGMTRNFNQDTLGRSELKAEEFRQRIHPVYMYAIESGVNADYGRSLWPKLPVCDAARRNTFHVGPDGTIWKCFPSIGTSRGRCGTVFEPDTKSPDALVYSSFDPFSFPECQRCVLLPLCMRRCPYEDMSLRVNDSICDFYRLPELQQRLEIVLASGNRNKNIVGMEVIRG